MDAGLVQVRLPIHTDRRGPNEPGGSPGIQQKLVEAIAARPSHVGALPLGLGMSMWGEESSRALAQHFHSLETLAGRPKKTHHCRVDVGPVLHGHRHVVLQTLQQEPAQEVRQSRAERSKPRKGRPKGISGSPCWYTGTMDRCRAMKQRKIRSLGGHASGT